MRVSRRNAATASKLSSPGQPPQPAQAPTQRTTQPETQTNTRPELQARSQTLVQEPLQPDLQADPGSRPQPTVVIFLAFAFAYFLSALLRAVTATLAPVFNAELGLEAADLGLLAGAYFFGFAAMQLPLGRALDGHGPRRTLVTLLAVAVSGCVAFALSTDLPMLIAARILIGAGVAACLMAPLTFYRRRVAQGAQLRINSWLLMTGSLGMMASTVPVQWLLPLVGWRGLFWTLATLLLLAALLLAWLLPAEPRAPALTQPEVASVGYAVILRHELFVRLAPLGFFVYGGLIAVQSLWAGPWLTRVVGWSAEEAAGGLFGINSAMLIAFLAWGAVMPRVSRRGFDALRLVVWGVPLALMLLMLNVALGSAAGALHWGAWCVACTVVSLSQPAVAAAFPAAQAGRALSAFNLVIFSGVFCVQWGIGLLVDGLRLRGFGDADAFRVTFLMFGLCSMASYAWFLRRPRHGADNLI